MPFGLHEAPATFQRLTDLVLVGQQAYLAAYINDVVVRSAIWTEHLTHLHAVFELIRRMELTVKAQKCQLALQECVYLGHIVSNGLVRPKISKIAVVQAFEQPMSKKEVQLFLGLTGSDTIACSFPTTLVSLHF